MSGGVDSSVAVAILVEQGYDVIGVTLHVMPAAKTIPAATEDAGRAAKHLGISLEVVDVAGAFERFVITNFTQEYLAGRTPNPCIRCNRVIKFATLLEKAAEWGADYVATGHYARVKKRQGRWALRRGADRRKDQSYMLAALAQEQLGQTLFPLGEAAKDDVRELARAEGLPTAEREESQEACFIPDGDYRAFLLERLGKPKPGPILSADGELLGHHKGLIYYTIGQRRGLGISDPRPYYVTRLDAERNAVIVGHEEEVLRDSLVVRDINWVSLPPQSEPFDCLAQIRYRHTPTPATVMPTGNKLEVRLKKSQPAVAPGQSAVLYDDDGYVLAGGIIDA